MPIDNFNGFNTNSKELGFVVHTDEILERGNQLFFTKSRVLAVLSEFFETTENSEIQLELKRVYVDPSTSEILYDEPIIVGDFLSLEDDLADGNYIISASIKRVPISKIDAGTPNTVLVTDSDGNIVWRESENFRVIRPDEIQPGFKNTLMITNNDRAVQWLRFNTPNSILTINSDNVFEIISSSEDGSVLVVKDGKLVFDKDHQPLKVDINKLEAGTKKTILSTDNTGSVVWSPINELLNIMDNTKKLDYIRGLVPFFAQINRLYDFHIETFVNDSIIDAAVNIKRSEVDGIITFNTTTSNAILETKNLSFNKQFNKILVSTAPTYDYFNIFYTIDDGITWTLINAPIEFTTPRDSMKLKFVVNKSDTTPVELDFYGFFAVFDLGV